MSARPHRIAVAEPLALEPAAWLDERAERLPFEERARGEVERLLAAADGLVVRTYTQVDRALLEQAPRLRVVGRAGVGLENVDVAACRERGIEVVYTPEANAAAVVEYVFAVALDALRPRRTLTAPVPAEIFDRYRREDVGAGLAGRTLGIVGLGRIGRRVAAAGRAFGMDVLAHDLLDAAALALPPGLAEGLAPEERVLGEADVLTLHVDGRPANRGWLDEARLARLHPHALVVNAARGMVVDAEALARWAAGPAAGAGGGAVLDVHEPEPPPAGSPFWGLANVRLTAHVAARSQSALTAMSWVVRDVLGVLRGEPARFPAPPAEAAC